jgi:hypothetical protein
MIKISFLFFQMLTYSLDTRVVVWGGGGLVEKKTARHLSTAKSHNAWISLVNYSISELYVGS